MMFLGGEARTLAALETVAKRSTTNPFAKNHIVEDSNETKKPLRIAGIDLRGISWVCGRADVGNRPNNLPQISRLGQMEE